MVQSGFRWVLWRCMVYVLYAVAIPTDCMGQEDIPKWTGIGIEANLIAGKVIKHEAKFTLPIPSLSTGLDLNLVYKTYGKKAWHQGRHYPTLGLGLTYLHYGNDAVYGNCLGVYPNITIPLYTGKKLALGIRLGDGIGYVNKTYSRTAPVDTINVAIGAHFNDFAMIAGTLRYTINQHWDMELGADMIHISNASTAKPNLGINSMGLTIGIRYFPVSSHPVTILEGRPALKNRWLVEMHYGMAMVASYSPGGPSYPVYLGSANVAYRWRGKNKLMAGLDYSYHSDTYYFLKNAMLTPGKEAQNSWKSGLVVGNEFLYGRVGILLQLGYYLKQSYIRKDDFYERIGVNYYMVQKEKGPIRELFLSAHLKSHGNVAELGELGVGVGF